MAIILFWGIQLPFVRFKFSIDKDSKKAIQKTEEENSPVLIEKRSIRLLGVYIFYASLLNLALIYDLYKIRDKFTPTNLFRFCHSLRSVLPSGFLPCTVLLIAASIDSSIGQPLQITGLVMANIAEISFLSFAAVPIYYRLFGRSENEGVLRDEWNMGLGVLLVYAISAWQYYTLEYESQGTSKPGWTNYLG